MNLIVKAADASSEWCLSGVGNDFYNVRNKQTGNSIDVQNWAVEHLANVATWPYYGGANQNFRLVLANDAPGVAPIAPSQPPTPPPNNDHITSWKGPFETPVVGVALANFPNGKILFWSAFMRELFGYDTGSTWTALYDPATDDLSELLVSNTNHDMFCPGTANMENGNLMVTGGADAAVTSIYDYKTNTFSTGASMVIARGYHSMAVLGSGEIFTAGGSWHGEQGPAGLVVGGRDGEVWNPSTNTWRLLPGVPADPLLSQDVGGVYRSDNHFWLFQSPVENMLFHAGPSRQMSFVDTSGNGAIIPSVARDDIDRMNGNALMIDVGVVFIVGGAANYDTGAGTTKAFLVDINNPNNVQSREVGNMQFARTLSNSVLLPGGFVVVTGGQSQTLLFSDEFAVMQTEIFDPATETFTTLPETMRIPRTYHSASILMIDGRVLVAGGGMCGGCSATHNDFEILVPPYLIQADGSLAPRPTISSAPSVTNAGASIQITMANNADYTFELIRTSSVTHSVNNDQRRIPLARTGKSGSVSTLKIPDNRNVALSGTYYLFAINSNGVPSVATSIQIELSGPGPTPAAAPIALIPDEGAPSSDENGCTSNLSRGGACCLASCGECGGRGCSSRSGGRDGCCTSAILNAGRSCLTNPPPCVE